MNNVPQDYEEVARTYINGVEKEHRSRYGQFFTPPNVARLMVEWVLQDKPAKVLDPAVGLGFFQLK